MLHQRLFIPLLLLSVADLFVLGPLFAARIEVRLLDASTSQPVAARVYLQSKDGTWHHFQSADPKNGSAIEYRKNRGDIGSIEIHTTVSAHPFFADVPDGEYELTIVRGKEYHPIRDRVEAKGTVSKTYKLERWIDMSKMGWYSGDTHVHRPIKDLSNIVLAEDLNVALPLTQWVTRSHTTPAKGGRSSAPKPETIRASSKHLIYTLSTEYEIFSVGAKRHTLGAVFVLGHKKPLDIAVPPVRPVATEARRQGALLDLDKHSWPWSMMIVPVMNVDLFELSNNHVWRTNFGFPEWTIEAKADYMKVETNASGGWTEWGWLDFGFQNYYALLNCGYRMRPTAGTASGVHPVPLGFGRVYVNVGDDFSLERWMDQLNQGNSFVTTGPMLFTNIGGHRPGARVKFSGARELEVKIRAEHTRKLQRIELIINGDIAKTLTPKNERTKRRTFISDHAPKISLKESRWIVVRCFEQNKDGRIRFAHSSPVFFDKPGSPIRPKKAELNYLISLMDREIKRNQDLLDENAIQEYKQAREAYQKLQSIAR